MFGELGCCVGRVARTPFERVTFWEGGAHPWRRQVMTRLHEGNIGYDGRVHWRGGKKNLSHLRAVSKRLVRPVVVQ